MALQEIEFDLTAQQFALMNYPHLQQGQSLEVQLETAVLLPEPGAESWFAVQKEPLPMQFVRVGCGAYAFAGQIQTAELVKEEGMESATVVVDCGVAPVRMTCAPDDEGRLPYGTWETRYIMGTGRLFGAVEEDFSIGVGERIGVIIWEFHRLVLKPGDVAFGSWYTSTELPPTPLGYDRVVVTARVHRSGM